MNKLPNFLTSFLAAQTESFLIDFRDNTPCLIAATPEKLKQLAITYNWYISTLPNIRATSALVIGKQNSGFELWVRSRYSNYRKAFQKFLDTYYSKYNVTIPKNFQVDHLHPSSGFTKENHNYFTRLALIYRGINTSYGGGFEKILYQREKERKINSCIHMDWMAFLKAWNIPIIKKSVGINGWKTWAWNHAKYFEIEQLDPVFSYIGITLMLNLSYRNKWQPLSPHNSFIDEITSYPSHICCPDLMSYD